MGTVPDNSSVLYEFVIGSSLNKLCAIRFSKSGKNEGEAHVENALNGDQFRDFWVSADAATGRVALGTGDNISANVIMNITDAPPGVRGIPAGFAVMTPATFGAWRFPEIEQDADADVSTSSEVSSSSSSSVFSSSSEPPPAEPPPEETRERIAEQPNREEHVALKAHKRKARVVPPVHHPHPAPPAAQQNGLRPPETVAKPSSSSQNEQSSNSRSLSPPPKSAGATHSGAAKATERMRQRLRIGNEGFGPLQ